MFGSKKPITTCHVQCSNSRVNEPEEKCFHYLNYYYLLIRNINKNYYDFITKIIFWMENTSTASENRGGSTVNGRIPGDSGNQTPTVLNKMAFVDIMQWTRAHDCDSGRYPSFSTNSSGLKSWSTKPTENG